MKTASKIIAILLAAALLAPLAGCGAVDRLKNLIAGTETKEAVTGEAQSGTAAESASGTAALSGAENADSGSSADEGSAESGEAGVSERFEYSAGIGEDGYLEGVKALELVTLPDYMGVEIPEKDHTASEDEINEQLASLLSSYKQTVQITDRAVENGDSVNIDYVGSVDGVEFESGNTQGKGTTVTAGATNYIGDFLTQIIGHMPGETFNVEVTFPDEYPNDPDLAGKDAVFVTTINYISETVDPELTDDFVKENLTEDYRWESAAEVTEYMRSIIVKQKLHSFVDDYLAQNTEFSSLPESLVEYQKKAMLAYYESYASQYGVSLEDFIAGGGYDSVDALVEDQKEAIENAAKSVLVIQAVAEKENISVTEEDVNSFILDAYLSATEEVLPQIKEYYGLGYWAQQTLSDRVYTLIADNAKLQ